jgi:long-chain fatty acid transport protein
VMAGMPSIHAEAMDGSWRSDTESSTTPVPQLYAARADGDWAFGVAVNVPYGGGVSWPSDWEGRHEIVSTRLAVVRAAPFAAWRAGAWRIAGGLHVDAGQLTIRRGLDFIDVDGDVLIDLRGVGVGVDLAAFARVLDDGDGDGSGGLDVGVSYKSRTKIGFGGEADFTAPDAFSMKTVDQEASTTMTMPDRIAAGLAWRRGAWRTLADVELTLWQVNQALVIDFAEAQTPDATQQNHWHRTIAVRAGAEWHGGRWVVRGGGYVDPTPADAEHMAASSPDATRLGLSLGASRRLATDVTVDAFYGYLHLVGRASENPDSLAARYGGHAQMLGLGLRWMR